MAQILCIFLTMMKIEKVRKMKAIVCEKYGSPDLLQVKDVVETRKLNGDEDG